MSQTWDDSDEEEVAPAAPVPAVVVPKKKWEGEDEEEEVADEWDASSDEEESKSKPATVAAPKKKGTLKAKIAEKNAAKAAQKASILDDEEEEDDDDDESVDESEQRRRDKERELEADLNNATELLGAAAIGGVAPEIAALIAANPRTKDDFIKLSDQIIALILSRHESKPLYPTFIEHHVRALAQPLRDVEVRKAATALTTLANEKQKEARDRTSGKKKPKAAAKPSLGGLKANGKLDTRIYDESLDDFGKDADDFM